LNWGERWLLISGYIAVVGEGLTGG